MPVSRERIGVPYARPCPVSARPSSSPATSSGRRRPRCARSSALERAVPRPRRGGLRPAQRGDGARATRSSRSSPPPATAPPPAATSIATAATRATWSCSQLDDLDGARARARARPGSARSSPSSCPTSPTSTCTPRHAAARSSRSTGPTRPGSWRWGGPAWDGAVPAHGPGGVRGATVRAADPDAMAARWAHVLGAPLATATTLAPRRRRRGALRGRDRRPPRRPRGLRPRVAGAPAPARAPSTSAACASRCGRG